MTMGPTAHLAASPPDALDDPLALAVPFVVRSAGGAVLGAGALAILIGIQTLTGFWLTGSAKAMLVGLMVLGAATGWSGLMLMRARSGAAVAASVLSGLLFLATSGWLVRSAMGGLVSLFGIGAPLVSFVALLLAIFAIDRCKSITEARARLRAQGLDMGI